jgi:hypothetical protein
MGTTVIGFILGAVVGATIGGEPGGVAGGIMGALLAASLYAGRWLWAHSGDRPVVERHRVMCTPLGSFADIGRWYDVERCSLEGPGKVTCDKTCLRLVNISRVRPGRPCRCGAHEPA